MAGTRGYVPVETEVWVSVPIDREELPQHPHSVASTVGLLRLLGNARLARAPHRYQYQCSTA